MSITNYKNDVLNSGINHHGVKPVQIPGLIWYYGLWIILGMLSTVLGHSSIATENALFLLCGIATTNVFFLTIAYNEPRTRSMARLLACYQTIMGIAWVSAYYYFSYGSHELVLGMYMTLLMFAVFHLSTRILLKLALSIMGAYLFMFSVKYLSMPALMEPLIDGINFLVLVTITTWVYLFAKQLRDLRFELQFRNEELQTIVDEVTRIAERDHLTKSYNRRYIMDVLARERARADRAGNTFSLLLFDLDHFKSVNDRFGHLVGDQILSDFALCAKEALRGMDTMNNTEYKRSFGRYGGEEFIAVLPGTGIRGAHVCAERIRKLISTREFENGYSLTVSIGVAEYQHGETVPQILKRADEALYRAKRDGRNLVRCSPAPDITDKPEVSRPNLRVLK